MCEMSLGAVFRAESIKIFKQLKSVADTLGARRAVALSGTFRGAAKNV